MRATEGNRSRKREQPLIEPRRGSRSNATRKLHRRVAFSSRLWHTRLEDLCSPASGVNVYFLSDTQGILMNSLRTVVLGCGLLLAASPVQAQDQDIRKLIVGKWETSQKIPGGEDIKVEVDFARDGKATVTVQNLVLPGKYKFISDTTLELELKLKDGGLKKITQEAKLSGDTLELKDANGKVDKFKRVK
jgi:uncharacterized protein (TIGR03066 family)